MIKECYEVIFEVTETCQNGNERTKKVSVYQPRFINGHKADLCRILKFYAE